MDIKKIIAGIGLGVACLSVASVVSAQVTETQDVNLQVNVQDTLTLNCGGSGADPDVDFGTLTPGTPVVQTSVCTVGTNSENGFDLFVDRTDNAQTSVLQHQVDSATYIPDLTAWNGTAGSAWVNGTTQGLGFRVQSVSGATKNNTWWGASTNCTSAVDATALYAGIPEDPNTSTPLPIMDHDTYVSGNTTTTMCYKLDASNTQKSGVYAGDITYTAISKP